MFYFSVWTVTLRVVTVSVNISCAGNDGACWRHWSWLWALPCSATQTGWRWLWHEGGWFTCQVHQDLGWQTDLPGVFWHTIRATAQRQPNSEVRNVYVREFLTLLQHVFICGHGQVLLFWRCTVNFSTCFFALFILNFVGAWIALQSWTESVC